jgi:hypothetical protein
MFVNCIGPQKRKYEEPFKEVLVANKEYSVSQEDISDIKLDSLYNIIDKYNNRVLEISDEFEKEIESLGFDCGMSIINLK